MDKALFALPKNQLFEELKNEVEWRFRVGSTIFIDDFLIFSFQIGRETYLLWKLEQQSSFDDLKHYPSEVQMESINTEIIEEIINKVEAEFKELGILT